MSLQRRGSIVAKLIDGQFSVEKFGANGAVGASVEDIWTTGGAYTGWLTSADTVRVAAGGNANDTAAGSGTRSVFIQGLDSNWDLADETVATKGASASDSTTTQFIRVFRFYALASGTYGGANAADITIETTGGTGLGKIVSGRGQSEVTMYSIARGYTAKLERVIIEVESANTAQIRMFQRQNANVVTAPFTGKRLVFKTEEFTGFEQFEFAGIEFPQYTDLWFDGIKVTGGGDAKVNINYELTLVKKVV